MDGFWLSMADLILGIVLFSRLKSQGGTFPTPLFVIWIISIVILIGITIWAALDFRGIKKQK
jgi:hypothetical protein